MPVAPSTSTVPSSPTSSRRATSGIQPATAGFIPAATASGSAPAGSSTSNGVTSHSAIVPHGERARPV
uniref:hypothetical protein n=1 Tax=Nonomuraea gerenzanensis TaxID=93944 RepID=UPI00287F674B|nr:hypothetical protein [Nonomuraea gerenzanensis]